MKVNAVLPEFPSALFASVAAIAHAMSSSRIVPAAVSVVIWAPAEAFESVTEKSSFGSMTASPLTFTVIVLLVSPAAKLTWPLGSVPPKSAALAGLVPLPVTA